MGKLDALVRWAELLPERRPPRKSRLHLRTEQPLGHGMVWFRPIEHYFFV
jgi:hypothetical protein